MIKINLDNFNTREKWLQLRKSGIGGSDASVVMGRNKYKCKMELWLEKTNQMPAKEEEKEVTYWGHVLEDVIRKEFTLRTGITVRTIPFMYRSEEYPFMTANLDGEVDDETYGTCIFEAKTVSQYKKDEWQDGIPIEYYLQVQHYMAVTGYKGAYIAALIGGNEYIYNFIERDDHFIEKIIKAEKEFWDKVMLKEMPEIEGNEPTKEFLAIMYPDATSKKPLELDARYEQLVLRYDELKAQELQLKEAKLLVENSIKSLMGKNEVAIIGNRKITWKNIVSTRFDTSLFKINEPEMYADYANECKTRKFEIK